MPRWLSRRAGRLRAVGSRLEALLGAAPYPSRLRLDPALDLRNSQRFKVSLHPPVQRVLQGEFHQFRLLLTLSVSQAEFAGCQRVGASVYAAAKTAAGLKAVKFTQQFWNMRATDMLEEPNAMSFHNRLHHGYRAQLDTVVAKYIAEVAQGRELLDRPNTAFPPMTLHAGDHRLLLQRMAPADEKGSRSTCFFLLLLCFLNVSSCNACSA